jgi:hypothetical protein
MTGTFTANRYAGTDTVGTMGGLAHSVLLTNGNVLIVGSGGFSWILEPDRKGIYLSGSWRRIADSPCDMLYGAVWTTNDGRVVFFGGEYGAGAAVFNPKTETWTSLSNGLGHAPSGMGDDGRVIFHGQYIEPNATSFTSSAGLTPGSSEEPIVLLPSGKLAGFDAQSSAKTVFIISPNYPSAYTSSGTSSGDNSTVRIDYSATLTAFSDNNWNGQVGAGKNWCSNKNINPSYELGAAFWMNKIGKMGLIGGDGYIYTYDPTTSTLERPAAIGWREQSTSYFLNTRRVQLGVVRSQDNGRTINSIRNSGSFTFSYDASSNNDIDKFVAACNGSSPNRPFISLILSEGNSFVMLKVPITSQPNTTIDTINKTVTISTAMYYGAYGAQENLSGTGAGVLTVSTGTIIDATIPFCIAQDAPAAILPNGDVIFSATVPDYDVGFSYSSAWRKWDGTSSTTVNIESASGSDYSGFPRATFEKEIYPLPDGTYFVKGNGISDNGYSAYFNNRNPSAAVGYYCHYIPDSAEATPINGSRPTLTSFPPTVEPSETVFISGTTLTGVNEGGYFGDDRTPRSNYPIIRFTRVSDGDVYFGRTYNFSYRGIAPGRASTCYCDVPSNIPAGSYNVHVITNGIPSASAIAVTVKSSGQQQGTSPILINPYQR